MLCSMRNIRYGRVTYKLFVYIFVHNDCLYFARSLRTNWQVLLCLICLLLIDALAAIPVRLSKNVLLRCKPWFSPNQVLSACFWGLARGSIRKTPQYKILPWTEEKYNPTKKCSNHHICTHPSNKRPWKNLKIISPSTALGAWWFYFLEGAQVQQSYILIWITAPLGHLVRKHSPWCPRQYNIRWLLQSVL